MDQRVDVEWIPEYWRDCVPEQSLLHLVVQASEFNSCWTQCAEALHDTADVGIYGKHGPIERTHHDAGGALGADLWEAAEEMEHFVIAPEPRWLERAFTEAID